MHDPAAPSRLKAPIAGVYSITGAITFDANGTGVRALAVGKPGTTAGVTAFAPNLGASRPGHVDVATVHHAPRGDDVDRAVMPPR